MIGALGLIGGKYRLVRELGRGAFGAVYAARVEPSGEAVAVKVLARFDQGRSIERFRREVQVLSRVEPHPNIVRVLDSGEHGGLPFVAMELVPGGSLAAALREGRRPAVAQAAKIAEQVAAGLEHLHRSGIVHRDVNANNVLIDESGNARLVDFGLALDQQRVTRITETGELVGTPLCFAPEQLDGKTDAVGPAADIYATAALLYELLTGRPPFQDSKTFRELAHRIRTELPPPADEINPQVPRGLARAVELGLAKSAADRPRTAAELAKLVSQGLRGPGSRSTATVARAQLQGEGPRQVGPFVLGPPLGRGRRGIVYSARRIPDGPEVALRVLAVSGELAGAFAQYSRAVETLKRVHHPRVVPVLAAGIEDGYAFVASELVPGETLRKRLERERKLSPALALEIAAFVARGVAAAHASGVFHGDLRAEDILLDPARGPRTGDFLLEAILSRAQFPEGEGKARDVRALGGILQEMLTGRRTQGSPLRQEAEKKGEPLARAALRVALRAQDEAAQLRHADATAFADDCERAASRVGLAARLAAWAWPAPEQGRAGRARAALGAAAALLLAASSLLAWQLVASGRAAEGRALLARAKEEVRTGARPEEVGGIVAKGLSLAGSDEATLVGAGETLLEAGDVAGAARVFAEAAAGAGSLEALFLLDRTDERVEQAFAPAGESARRLVARAAEARAAGSRLALLERIAEARLAVERGTARAETLRTLAASFVQETAEPAEVSSLRALLLLEAGELGPAEDEATAALAAIGKEHAPGADLHDGRAADPLFLRARARSERGELALAESDLGRLLDLVPGHARALALRAATRARAGNAAGARADLAASTQGVYAKAPPAVLLADWAIAEAEAGDALQAIEHMNRAQDEDKRNPLIALGRARLAERRASWDDASSALEDALSLEPARLDLVLLEEARLHAARNGAGDAAKARAALERALAENRSLVPALLLRGELEAAQGEKDRALASFEEAARLAPWSSEARARLEAARR